MHDFLLHIRHVELLKLLLLPLLSDRGPSHCGVPQRVLQVHLLTAGVQVVKPRFRDPEEPLVLLNALALLLELSHLVDQVLGVLPNRLGVRLFVQNHLVLRVKANVHSGLGQLIAVVLQDGAKLRNVLVLGGLSDLNRVLEVAEIGSEGLVGGVLDIRDLDGKLLNEVIV